MQRPNTFVSSIKDQLEWFSGDMEAGIPVEKGFSFITGLQGTPDCKIQEGISSVTRQSLGSSGTGTGAEKPVNGRRGHSRIEKRSWRRCARRPG